MDVRILIIASDPLARAGLAAMVSSQPGLAVTGVAAADDDLEAALATFRPEVILWDLGWDPAGEVERLAALATGAGGLGILALLSGDVSARAALEAGARGLLPRSASVERIAAAAGAVAQGLVVIEREIATDLLPEAEDVMVDIEPLIEPLTTRELEVLRLLAEGLPNKAIARRLDISEHTVKFHVNAILGKLAVGSRTEAVVRATRLGLIFL